MGCSGVLAVRAGESCQLTYPEPGDVVANFALRRALVLNLNRTEKGIAAVVVRREIFAEEHEVGGQAESLKKVEDGDDVDGGCREADAEQRDDTVQRDEGNDAHDPTRALERNAHFKRRQKRHP